MADEVDELYAAPLAEFTSRRNALAKERGDASIKELKKPSVAAWAVNQLARRREVDLRRLLRAGEALEQTQAAALRGGDPAAFERARADEREAVRRLRAAAAEILRADGHAASDATLERVVETLHAGAASEAGRAALREARLTEELEPQGFDALAALAGSLPKGRRVRGRTPSAPKEAARRRAEQAREAAAAARREADDAARELAAAERELEALRRGAERAAAKAERLEAKARELS